MNSQPNPHQNNYVANHYPINNTGFGNTNNTWQGHNMAQNGANAPMPPLARGVNPNAPMPPLLARGVNPDSWDGVVLQQQDPNHPQLQAYQQQKGRASISPAAQQKRASGQRDDELFLDGKLYRMPLRKEDLHRELVRVVTKFERERVKLEAMKKRCTKFEEELIELKKTSVKSVKNEKTELLIKSRFASHMFRKRKFINDGTEQLAATEEMYAFCHHDKDKQRMGKEHKTNWVNTYKDTVTSVCNKRRSTIQGALRTAVMVFAEKRGRSFTMDEIRKCTHRRLDLKKPDDVQLFTWYWTELLGKCEKYGQVGHL